MKKSVFKTIASVAAVFIFIEAMFAIGWVLGGDFQVVDITVPVFGQEDIPVVAFTVNDQPQSLYDWAYDQAKDVEHVDAKSAIVAHHLVVADEIAKVFETLSDDSVDTVIIMSPNHFDLGATTIQTTMGSWDTYYGEVEADQDLIEDLAGDIEVLRIEDETFEYEHGISGLLPFVARSFPDAKIVPLVIHESLSDEDRDTLAESINEHAKNAVIFASIDMSHNLPEHTQNFHDEITLRALEIGDAQDIELEIDANVVLNTLLAINNDQGSQEWHLTHHDSSLGMELTDNYTENTSHILGYFTDGESYDDIFATLHIVGDIMLDRGVRSLLESEGQDYPWLNMGRFLSGAHTVIGNLEGTVNELASTYTVYPPFRFVFSPDSIEVMNEYIDVVSLANNHASDVGSAGLQETKDRLDEMEIPWFGSYATPVPRYDETLNGIDLTYIGYHQFQPDSIELVAQIEAADDEGRFVTVFPHWGSEYVVAPSSSQRELAQLMVDAGADLIIGGHPHVAQGIEIIDDVPVVYSLGNFIFDQIDPATYPALTAGLIIDDSEIEIYLMPVWTQGSQPTPMSDQEALDLFSDLAEVSSDELVTQIKNGVITTSYTK
ncbi:AmmeMemoRadiSam system protein B [Candidatus Uhrbacteria bacterium]|jgi:AmmeMemoRadiSam system protein B|nr:AmmeMemoRadiSam system protein B [Candidatus Uhrbacteria bacterium]MBT7716979.1 AmmeMemoRadiSam system protein B [Candidatus Uhrbacteria bacterium]